MNTLAMLIGFTLLTAGCGTSTAPPDAAADLSRPFDFAPAPDLTSPVDLAPQPDLLPSPDLAKEVIACGGGKSKLMGDCQAADVAAEGNCRCIIGWYFAGKLKGCLGLGGCTCAKGCDKIYASETDCTKAYAHCDNS